VENVEENKVSLIGLSLDRQKHAFLAQDYFCSADYYTINEGCCKNAKWPVIFKFSVFQLESTN
jgi:hypothetical protein